MLEYVTAGESHGAGLHAILTGLPAGLAVDRAFVDGALAGTGCEVLLSGGS